MHSLFRTALAITCASGSSALAVSPESNSDAADIAALLQQERQAVIQQLLCYPPDLTPEERQAILDRYSALPPTFFGDPDNLRFFTDSTVWTGDLSQGPSGRAAPARFTYSFPADGTIWGLSAVDSIGPSNLDAKLLAEFGPGNLDLGREYIRQALASWRKFSGNTYIEVADDNAPMDQLTARVQSRGDIRIGGRDFGTGGFLAYNAFPSDAFASIGGGDMVLNNSFWSADNFANPASNYRYLRNTVAHEHGHGLGFIHTTPCNETKLMEPFISVNFDAVSPDDRRNAGRNYGDRLAGNHTLEDAHDLGSLTDGGGRSVAFLQLSTNGANGFNNTDQDWFSFTLDSQQSVRITVTPTGGSYSNGQQFFSCFGFNSTVNAQNAGNLNLTVFDSKGQIASAASAPAGSPESLTLTLEPGSYAFRVQDVGPNNANNQITQLYDLRVVALDSPSDPDGIPTEPYANAGLNSKRVSANTNAWFIGDINSQATQTGATITSYDWDLDGDGVFDALDTAKPVTQYESNGSYEVTLRVTDSNGKQATDTVLCEVFGATTTLAYEGPAELAQGQSLPIVLTGTNLKNATAADFSISGSGVILTGTPTPNARGTIVTGLSLEADSAADLGPRSITIANADGTAAAIDAFTIVEGVASCPPDVDESGSVDLDDLNLVLTNFGQSTSVGDTDGNGVVDLDDLNAVLTAFGTDCP